MESIEKYMSKTLNKDGTPRKIGSGKTKGAGCFAHTTLSTLRDLIADDAEFPVSRVWLRDLGALEQDKTVKKNIPAPAVILSDQRNELEPELEKEKAKDHTFKEEGFEPTEDEYEPPPLFAVKPNNFLQY